MPALIPEKGLVYWNIQRTALLQYIEAARNSDEGTEVCKIRFMALRTSIMKIDIEIERLKAEQSRRPGDSLDHLKSIPQSSIH